MLQAAASSCASATWTAPGRLHRDAPGLAICRNLGRLDDPGLVSFPRPRIAQGSPGTRPTSRSPTSSPGGIRTSRPGFPPLALCTVTSDQLRRQDDGPRAACTTDEAGSATATQKTLSAA